MLRCNETGEVVLCNNVVGFDVLFLFTLYHSFIDRSTYKNIFLLKCINLQYLGLLEMRISLNYTIILKTIDNKDENSVKE